MDAGQEDVVSDGRISTTEEQDDERRGDNYNGEGKEEDYDSNDVEVMDDEEDVVILPTAAGTSGAADDALDPGASSSVDKGYVWGMVMSLMRGEEGGEDETATTSAANRLRGSLDVTDMYEDSVQSANARVAQTSLIGRLFVCGGKDSVGSGPRIVPVARGEFPNTSAADDSRYRVAKYASSSSHHDDVERELWEAAAAAHHRILEADDTGAGSGYYKDDGTTATLRLFRQAPVGCAADAVVSPGDGRGPSTSAARLLGPVERVYRPPPIEEKEENEEVGSALLPPGETLAAEDDDESSSPMLRRRVLYEGDSLPVVSLRIVACRRSPASYENNDDSSSSSSSSSSLPPLELDVERYVHDLNHGFQRGDRALTVTFGGRRRQATVLSAEPGRRLELELKNDDDREEDNEIDDEGSSRRVVIIDTGDYGRRALSQGVFVFPFTTPSAGSDDAAVSSATTVVDPPRDIVIVPSTSSSSAAASVAPPLPASAWLSVASACVPTLLDRVVTSTCRGRRLTSLRQAAAEGRVALENRRDLPSAASIVRGLRRIVEKGSRSWIATESDSAERRRARGDEGRDDDDDEGDDDVIGLRAWKKGIEDVYGPLPLGSLRSLASRLPPASVRALLLVGSTPDQGAAALFDSLLSGGELDAAAARIRAARSKDVDGNGKEADADADKDKDKDKDAGNDVVANSPAASATSRRPRRRAQQRVGGGGSRGGGLRGGRADDNDGGVSVVKLPPILSGEECVSGWEGRTPYPVSFMAAHDDNGDDDGNKGRLMPALEEIRAEEFQDSALAALLASRIDLGDGSVGASVPVIDRVALRASKGRPTDARACRDRLRRERRAALLNLKRDALRNMPSDAQMEDARVRLEAAAAEARRRATRRRIDAIPPSMWPQFVPPRETGAEADDGTGLAAARARSRVAEEKADALVLEFTDRPSYSPDAESQRTTAAMLHGAADERAKAAAVEEWDASVLASAARRFWEQQRPKKPRGWGMASSAALPPGRWEPASKAAFLAHLTGAAATTAETMSSDIVHAIVDEVAEDEAAPAAPATTTGVKRRVADLRRRLLSLQEAAEAQAREEEEGGSKEEVGRATTATTKSSVADDPAVQSAHVAVRRIAALVDLLVPAQATRNDISRSIDALERRRADLVARSPEASGDWEGFRAGVVSRIGQQAWSGHHRRLLETSAALLAEALDIPDAALTPLMKPGLESAEAMLQLQLAPPSDREAGRAAAVVRGVIDARSAMRRERARWDVALEPIRAILGVQRKRWWSGKDGGGGEEDEEEDADEGVDGRHRRSRLWHGYLPDHDGASSGASTVPSVVGLIDAIVDQERRLRLSVRGSSARKRPAHVNACCIARVDPTYNHLDLYRERVRAAANAASALASSPPPSSSAGRGKNSKENKNVGVAERNAQRERAAWLESVFTDRYGRGDTVHVFADDPLPPVALFSGSSGVDAAAGTMADVATGKMLAPTQPLRFRLTTAVEGREQPPPSLNNNNNNNNGNAAAHIVHDGTWSSSSSSSSSTPSSPSAASSDPEGAAVEAAVREFAARAPEWQGGESTTSALLRWMLRTGPSSSSSSPVRDDPSASNSREKSATDGTTEVDRRAALVIDPVVASTVRLAREELLPAARRDSGDASKVELVQASLREGIPLGVVEKRRRLERRREQKARQRRAEQEQGSGHHDNNNNESNGRRGRDDDGDDNDPVTASWRRVLDVAQSDAKPSKRDALLSFVYGALRPSLSCAAASTSDAGKRCGLARALCCGAAERADVDAADANQAKEAETRREMRRALEMLSSSTNNNNPDLVARAARAALDEGGTSGVHALTAAFKVAQMRRQRMKQQISKEEEREGGKAFSSVSSSTDNDINGPTTTYLINALIAHVVVATLARFLRAFHDGPTTQEEAASRFVRVACRDLLERVSFAEKGQEELRRRIREQMERENTEQRRLKEAESGGRRAEGAASAAAAGDAEPGRYNDEERVSGPAAGNGLLDEYSYSDMRDDAGDPLGVHPDDHDDARRGGGDGSDDYDVDVEGDFDDGGDDGDGNDDYAVD